MSLLATLLVSQLSSLLLLVLLPESRPSSTPSSYVPKNYVMVAAPSSNDPQKGSASASASASAPSVDLPAHLDALRDRIRMRDIPNKEKADLLANLEGVSNTLAVDFFFARCV